MRDLTRLAPIRKDPPRCVANRGNAKRRDGSYRLIINLDFRKNQPHRTVFLYFPQKNISRIQDTTRAISNIGGNISAKNRNLLLEKFDKAVYIINKNIGTSRAGGKTFGDRYNFYGTGIHHRPGVGNTHRRQSGCQRSSFALRQKRDHPDPAVHRLRTGQSGGRHAQPEYRNSSGGSQAHALLPTYGSYVDSCGAAGVHRSRVHARGTGGETDRSRRRYRQRQQYRDLRIGRSLHQIQ